MNTLHDRVDHLESAALRFEGALFAVHDLIAHTLAHMSDTEVRRTLASLRSHADGLDETLGPERIAGYRDELLSIEQEIEHVRSQPQGILARFRRA